MSKVRKCTAVWRAAQATVNSFCTSASRSLRSWIGDASPCDVGAAGLLQIESLEPRLFMSTTTHPLMVPFHTVGAGTNQSFILGSGVFPDLPMPTLLPPLPTGVDPFSPPVEAGVLASGGPIIASSNDSGGPNDSIAVTGSGFSDSGSEFYIYGQTNTSNGQLLEAQIQDASTDGDIITISSSEPANSMYLIWPVSSSGVVGAPVAVNQTDATWFDATPTFTSTIPVTAPDPSDSAVYASPSQTISVYGQNLSNGNSQAWIYLQPSAGGPGTAIAISGKNVNNYSAQFALPSNIANGAYQVWINNGLGGEYGWSQAPGTLTVQAATTWPTQAQGTAGGFFNVSTYGATHNGSDAGPGILLAISAAQAYQRLHPTSLVTLFFPAGTYTISGGEQITLPTVDQSGSFDSSNVQVLGSSESTTKLVFTQAPINSGYGRFLIGSEDGHSYNIAFRNLTITYTGPATPANGAPIQLIRERTGANLTFDDVILNAGDTAEALDWSNSCDVTIENSSIYGGGANSGSPVILFGASDILIDAVAFYYMYNPQSAITAGGTTNACIIDCTAQDYNDALTVSGTPVNPNGWGDGRFLENALSFGPVQNEYVADNTTISLGAVPGAAIDHNTGEQILSEGAPDISNGDALAGGSNWVDIPFNAGVAVGQDVIVTDGTGTGQMRIITAIEDVTIQGAAALQLTLNQPWVLAPDTTSCIEVTNDVFNSVYYQNTLQDKTGVNGAADGTTAGEAGLQAACGFEVFTGGYNLVFANNTVNDTLSGVSLWNWGVANPCFYIDVTNNQINKTQTGIFFAPPSTPNNQDFIGVVLRSNTINGAAPNTHDPAVSGSGIIMAADSHMTEDFTGPATLSVIEHNIIENTPVGLTAYDDPNTFVYDNAFNAGTYAKSNSMGISLAGVTPSILLNNNTFANFITDYSTILSRPNPGVGAPHRNTVTQLLQED
jgi:hypothetical protein